MLVNKKQKQTCGESASIHRGSTPSHPEWPVRDGDNWSWTWLGFEAQRKSVPLTKSNLGKALSHFTATISFLVIFFFFFFFSYKSSLTGNPVFPTLGRIKVIRVNTWLDVSGLKQHFNWSRIIQWYSNRSFPVCDVCFSGWFIRPWLIFQVSRSFSQSTCRRSLSSRLWATLCATEKESTPVATTSAFVSVPRTTHNATVQSQTSRLWRTPCWECPSCGLPRTKTLRALVRNVFTTTKTFESLWQYCSISLK